MTIRDLARRLRAREVSAVELVEESLRRIRQSQPRINAFITITAELAIDEARRADEELARGFDRGPLHGIPYALKDNFLTRGIRTTAGSTLLADFVPDRDSTVGERLREAGAVLVGKTGLHELAYGVTSNNPHFGAVRNPRDPERIPGGSSGGAAAAVAADLIPFAIGTDTGGSVRIPAGFCGCVGLKPTIGRISRAGLIPLSDTLDHVGILAGTVDDAALVLNAIAGFDPRDPASSRSPVDDYPTHGAPGRRLGVPANFFFDRLAAPVAQACERALKAAERSGARLVSIRVPDPAEINVVGRVIQLSEASAAMSPYLGRRTEIGADVMSLLDQGRLIAATDYVNALRLRRIYQARWSELWKEVDLIFTPCLPIEAPRVGQTSVEREDVRMAATRLVRPINVLGLPAISLPLESSGLPVAAQLIGPAFGEKALLALANVSDESSCVFYDKP
jgi:aspartyl-tRNA(Asn)/glutamyl-tRNA(Gln) amidotransferase subunit A